MASKKAKGKRKKSRDLLKARKGRKATVNKLVSGFEKGERVVVRINPSMHSAMPPMRYHGKTGKVVGHRGRAFIVSLKIGNKDKELIVGAAHLLAAGGGKK